MAVQPAPPTLIKVPKFEGYEKIHTMAYSFSTGEVERETLYNFVKPILLGVIKEEGYRESDFNNLEFFFDEKTFLSNHSFECTVHMPETQEGSERDYNFLLQFDKPGTLYGWALLNEHQRSKNKLDELNKEANQLSKKVENLRSQLKVELLKRMELHNHENPNNCIPFKEPIMLDFEGKRIVVEFESEHDVFVYQYPTFEL
jgi:hypothetical protein